MEHEDSGNANLSGSEDSFDFEKGIDRTPQKLKPQPSPLKENQLYSIN
jgi:hypothetical protein